MEPQTRRCKVPLVLYDSESQIGGTFANSDAAQQKTASGTMPGSRLHPELFDETVDYCPVDLAGRPILASQTEQFCESALALHAVRSLTKT